LDRIQPAFLKIHIPQGKRVVMLQQVSANATSFSLYARRGFVPTETSQNFVGLVAEEEGKEGLDLNAYSCRKLSPADAPACDALFQRAMAPHHFSRRRELEGMLAQGGLTVYGLWSSGSEKDEEKEREGALVAYTTGAVLGGHLVAATPEAFKVLLYFISQALRQSRAAASSASASSSGANDNDNDAASAGAPLPPPVAELNFYVPGRLHPALLSWLFKRTRLRLVRQLTGMAFGSPPFPCVQTSGAGTGEMVYCPSILY
jgi:hypothetical protein